MKLSFLSQVFTGCDPAAREFFPGHAHDGLQQSQYRVVFPDPEACALIWRTKGRRDRRAALEINIVLEMEV